MKVAVLFLLFFGVSLFASESEIGVPAKGGYLEYLFLEKVSKKEAASTAKMISDALERGKMIIFVNMKLLNDPKIGDKGFTGELFLKKWKASLKDELATASPKQREIMNILFSAGKEIIENNQKRLNVKGIAWKNFLPAKWARETGIILISKTGIITKQPAIKYRHPSNAPDAEEKRVLAQFIKEGVKVKPYGEFSMMGKQKVYRYFSPILLMPACLSCHGKPKGEIDMLGFEKDGLEAGDCIGMISVSVAVED